jgi:hypothetical protein
MTQKYSVLTCLKISVYFDYRLYILQIKVTLFKCTTMWCTVYEIRSLNFLSTYLFLFLSIFPRIILSVPITFVICYKLKHRFHQQIENYKSNYNETANI